jgi:hypothetical protein
LYLTVFAGKDDGRNGFSARRGDDFVVFHSFGDGRFGIISPRGTVVASPFRATDMRLS